MLHRDGRRSSRAGQARSGIGRGGKNSHGKGGGRRKTAAGATHQHWAAGLRSPSMAVLIGERPGLSSPDSLGVYLTRAPKVGRSDAERNCLSNVRAEGLVHAEAARKLWWLAEAARRLGATGVALKDDSGLAPGAGLGVAEATPLPSGRSG